MDKKIGAFDNFYASILYRILKQQGTVHRRTGLLIKALPGIVYTSEKLPLLSLRDINIKWSCLEMVWAIAGRSDIKFFNNMGFHAWDMFADKDGHVESAYGHRWRNAFGRDQLMDIIKGLKIDPTQKQGFMTTWDQVSDGLCLPRKLNTPCVNSWHFHVIEDKLNLTVMQRSADMIVGYPHDILQGFILMALVASHLKIPTGSLTYLASNAHIYQTHFEQAEEMIERARYRCIVEDQCPRMSGQLISLIDKYKNDDDKLLTTAEILIALINEIYDPMPKIKGMKVIL